MDDRILIAGLGNPGKRYDETRHNAGFMTVDELARRHGISMASVKFDGDFGSGRIGGRNAILLKPRTFMNLSGKAVAAALSFYRIPPALAMVVCDDFAIPFGRIRLRSGGSDGGHNGLSDINSRLGTNLYPRLRIGIGPIPEPMPSPDFVLSRFSAEELRALSERIIPRACDALESFAFQGVDRAMSLFNGSEKETP